MKEEVVLEGRREERGVKIDNVTKKILIVGVFILAACSMFVFKSESLTIVSTVVGGVLGLLKGGD